MRISSVERQGIVFAKVRLAIVSCFRRFGRVPLLTMLVRSFQVLRDFPLSPLSSSLCM